MPAGGLFVPVVKCFPRGGCWLTSFAPWIQALGMRRLPLLTKPPSESCNRCVSHLSNRADALAAIGFGRGRGAGAAIWCNET